MRGGAIVARAPVLDDAARTLRPFVRKYLGSKRLLRGWIADRICQSAGVPESFLDGFFGTGSISHEMALRGARRISAVETLRSNCVILRGCCRAREEGSLARLAVWMRRLNELDPMRGYLTESYADTYFTAENCARMDAIREEMERLVAAGEVTTADHEQLLASFLLEADRVANTLGQYDAFLKNPRGPSMVDGRHLVDGRVRSPFRLRPLAPFPADGVDVIEGDLLQVASRMQIDVAYFDPPYNTRQYCDNYHVLENLARWEKPILRGKTRKFDRDGLKSPFSRRREAAGALAALIAATRARHLFLSYSSEGIVAAESIFELLSRRGEVRVFEHTYPVFGNGAGVSRRRNVVEYLFHVRG